MKRNRGGERDLDHIIMAASRGVDRARLEYPNVRAGLILMMDRTFTAEQNGVIVEKAIRYSDRGVVGVDIAGPRPDGGRYLYRELAPLVEEARAGRAGRHDPRRRGRRAPRDRGDRRGRGAPAAGAHRPRHPRRPGRGDDAGPARVRDRARDLPELEPPDGSARGRGRAQGDRAHIHRPGRAFTIATDGPEMMQTHLRDELALLLRIGALERDEADAVNARGMLLRSTPKGVVRKIPHEVNSRPTGSLPTSRHVQRLRWNTVHGASAAGSPADRCRVL